MREEQRAASYCSAGEDEGDVTGMKSVATHTNTQVVTTYHLSSVKRQLWLAPFFSLPQQKSTPDDNTAPIKDYVTEMIFLRTPIQLVQVAHNLKLL